MSSIYYAHLDSDDVCTSITQYEQALDNPPPDYVLVDSFDESLVDKKWNGSSWEVVVSPDPSAEAKAATAREWRNTELFQTDIFTLLPDHPNASNLLTYRAVLRDWPNTGDFPDTKPELGEE